MIFERVSMQFVIPSNVVLMERRECYVQHKGQEIAFSVRAFTPSAFETANEKSPLFTHINRYIATLSDKAQDDIFRIYSNIKNIFDMTTEFDVAKRQLISEVGDLYYFFNYDQIAKWMKHSTHDIVLPSTKHIRTHYIENDDRNHTKDKTYILSDYVDLINLIVQLRPMIFIWGEFIKNFSSATGTSFKEFSAYDLLSKTGVLETTPMQKLETYVKVVTPAEGSKEAIVEFISSEDYPMWNLALLIVRKVCLSDVRGLVDDTPIIIRHISTHLREKIKHSSNSFDGQIRSKTEKSENNQSEENQTSKLEAIKTKEEMAAGERMFIELMVKNPLLLAQQLDATCPPELVIEFYNLLTNTNLPPLLLSHVQEIITKQVCSLVMPHRGFDYLDREKLNCVAAVQAVLWNQGHTLIAGVLSAQALSDIKQDYINASSESKSKVQPELREKLLSLFPFTKKSKSGKETDVVSANIDLLVKLLSNETWILRLPPDKVALVNTTNPTLLRLTMPPNIKNNVIEYAIYVASRVPAELHSSH